MKPISIFAKFVISWTDTISLLNQIFSVNGDVLVDEVGNRCVWKFFGLELIAIDQPDLEDDCGIEFSVFNFEIDLVSIDQPSESAIHLDEMIHAIAKSLAARLARDSLHDTIVVENLQKEVCRFKG